MTQAKLESISKPKMSPEERRRVYMRELESIRKRMGLTPENIVMEARSKSSPLHDYFEWDDSIASGQWRTYQARQLINIMVVEDKGIPAYENVIIVKNGDSRREYVHHDDIMSNREWRRQVVASAMKEIQWWTRKNATYSEFAPIARAVRKVEKKIGGKGN